MDIKEKFIKEFPVLKGEKEKPYIILFDAYTGMGKSTVAREISKYDKSVILNNDEVRRWLSDYKDTTNLKDELQKYRLELLLKNNNSCIYDSCFCHHWKEKIKYFNELGYKYYIIRLICPENIIKERLEKRTLDGINFSIADYKGYLWMKENVELVDDDLIDYIINTEYDISSQVQEFLKNIK